MQCVFLGAPSSNPRSAHIYTFPHPHFASRSDLDDPKRK